MSKINFYSVIIGTELLNGRRKDAHFSFLNKELLKRDWEHKGSFVIEDDPLLMENIFTLIKNDTNSVMFCFGGIGSTPDDLTRQVAAKVFTSSQMEFHPKAKELIINQFGSEAYPHRINMSYLPINSKLLKNVVNNVPGFYLEDRFFFTPGFPSMNQAMVIEALDKYYKRGKKKYSLVLSAFCGESDLIKLMEKLPSSIDLSSLPRFVKDKRAVVLSLSSYDKKLLDIEFNKFTEYLNNKKIDFLLEDINFK